MAVLSRPSLTSARSEKTTKKRGRKEKNPVDTPQDAKSSEFENRSNESLQNKNHVSVHDRKSTSFEEVSSGNVHAQRSAGEQVHGRMGKRSRDSSPGNISIASSSKRLRLREDASGHSASGQTSHAKNESLQRAQETLPIRALKGKNVARDGSSRTMAQTEDELHHSATTIGRRKKPDPVLIQSNSSIDRLSTSQSAPHLHCGINQNIPPIAEKDADRRSLRSHGASGSRLRSELAPYFDDYDEMISIEKKDPELLTTKTILHISDDPTKGDSLQHPFIHPRTLVAVSKSRQTQQASESEIMSTLTKTAKFPAEVFQTLTNATRINLASLDHVRGRKSHKDPLSDALFLRVHAREMRKERQLRNIEKERAMHEKSQLERLLDGLKGHDWLRVLGVSGITETEKKAYEPKRDNVISEVRGLLRKFQTWKEEEKRQRLEKEEEARFEQEGTADEEEEEDQEHGDDEMNEGSERHDDDNDDNDGSNDPHEQEDDDDEVRLHRDMTTQKKSSQKKRSNHVKHSGVSVHDPNDDAMKQNISEQKGVNHDHRRVTQDGLPTTPMPRSTALQKRSTLTHSSGYMSDGDPPDYSAVDASAARQLHLEAVRAMEAQMRQLPCQNDKEVASASADAISKADVNANADIDVESLLASAIRPDEPPFTSFYDKTYMRTAALSHHRRSGRSRSAFGQPVPEFSVDCDFDLPPAVRETSVQMEIGGRLIRKNKKRYRD